MAARKFISEFTTEIEELLSNIDESIGYIKIRAEQMGISPYAMQHADGSLALERLLFAKAHALHTLVILKDTEWHTVITPKGI